MNNTTLKGLVGFFFAMFILSLTPWFMLFLDFYWWFFYDHTLSGLPYSGEAGAARTFGLLLTVVPDRKSTRLNSSHT